MKRVMETRQLGAAVDQGPGVTSQRREDLVFSGCLRLKQLCSQGRGWARVRVRLGEGAP